MPAPGDGPTPTYTSICLIYLSTYLSIYLSIYIYLSISIYTYGQWHLNDPRTRRRAAADRTALPHADVGRAEPPFDAHLPEFGTYVISPELF
jgi:hypothetical protein